LRQRRSRVYGTVGCPSIRLSVPAWDTAANIPAGRIYRSTAARRTAARRYSATATLSAYVVADHRDLLHLVFKVRTSTSYRTARRYAPADRGGSTSVRRRIRRPHSSGGRRRAPSWPRRRAPRPVRPTDGQTDRRTDGSRHRFEVNAPLRRRHNNNNLAVFFC